MSYQDSAEDSFDDSKYDEPPIRPLAYKPLDEFDDTTYDEPVNFATQSAPSAPAAPKLFAFAAPKAPAKPSISALAMQAEKTPDYSPDAHAAQALAAHDDDQFDAAWINKQKRTDRPTLDKVADVVFDPHTYAGAAKGLWNFGLGLVSSPLHFGASLQNHLLGSAAHTVGLHDAGEYFDKKAVRNETESILSGQGVENQTLGMIHTMQKPERWFTKKLGIYDNLKKGAKRLGISDKAFNNATMMATAAGVPGLLPYIDPKDSFRAESHRTLNEMKLAQGIPLETGLTAAMTPTDGQTMAQTYGPDALERMGVEKPRQWIIDANRAGADPMNVAMAEIPHIPAAQYIGGQAARGTGFLMQLPKAGIRKAVSAFANHKLAGGGGAILAVAELYAHNPKLAEFLAYATAGAELIGKPGEWLHAEGKAMATHVPSPMTQRMAVARRTGVRDSFATAQKIAGDMLAQPFAAWFGMAPLNLILSEGDAEKFMHLQIGAAIFSMGMSAARVSVGLNRGEINEAIKPYLRQVGLMSLDHTSPMGLVSADTLAIIPEHLRNAALEVAGVYEGMPVTLKDGSTAPMRLYFVDAPTMQQVAGNQSLGIYKKSTGEVFINMAAKAHQDPRTFAATAAHEINHGVMETLKAENGPVYKAIMEAAKVGLYKNGKPTPELLKFIDGYNAALPKDSEYRLDPKNIKAIEEVIAEHAGNIMANRSIGDYAIPDNIADKITNRMKLAASFIMGDPRLAGGKMDFGGTEIAEISEQVRKVMQDAGLLPKVKSPEPILPEPSKQGMTPEREFAKGALMAKGVLPKKAEEFVLSCPDNMTISDMLQYAANAKLFKQPKDAPVRQPKVASTPATRYAEMAKAVREALIPAGVKQPGLAYQLMKQAEQANGKPFESAKEWADAAAALSPEKIEEPVVVMPMEEMAPEAAPYPITNVIDIVPELVEKFGVSRVENLMSVAETRNGTVFGSAREWANAVYDLLGMESPLKAKEEQGGKKAAPTLEQVDVSIDDVTAMADEAEAIIRAAIRKNSGKPDSPALARRIRDARVFAAAEYHASQVGPEYTGIRLHTDPLTGRREISGTIDPTRGFDAFLLNEAGLVSRDGYLYDGFNQALDVQARLNKPTTVVYWHAPEAEGARVVNEGRLIMQDIFTPQARAEGRSPYREAKKVIIPMEMVFSVGEGGSSNILIRGLSPEKLLNNANNALDLMKSAGWREEHLPYTGASDPNLHTDITRMSQNQKHGYTGDGRPLAGAVVDPEYQPHIIPKAKYEFLNLIMGDESAKADTALGEHKRNLAKANNITVGADGEVNALRKTLNEFYGPMPGRDGKPTTWSKHTMENPLSETLRADLIQSVGDANKDDKSIRPHGYKGDLGEMFSLGTPNRDLVSAMLRPDSSGGGTKELLQPATEQERTAYDKAVNNNKMARNGELAVAAVRLKNGEITPDEYARYVEELDPWTVKGAEPLPSTAQLRKYLKKDQVPKLGAKIPNGKEVEIRIDIPVYTESAKVGEPVYAITAHEPSTPNGRVGTPISYLPAARLTGVSMETRPTTSTGRGGAISIAMGEAKYPLATVKGKYSAIDKLPPDINDPSVWTEVGYNPVRSSEFVDVRTGKVVSGGTEAIMVGPRVFVKKPTYRGLEKSHDLDVRYRPDSSASEAGQYQGNPERNTYETDQPNTEAASGGGGRAGIRGNSGQNGGRVPASSEETGEYPIPRGGDPDRVGGDGITAPPGHILFSHWSRAENLDVLDPGYYGKGIPGAESKRKINDPENWVDRSYVGINGYQREHNLPGNKFNGSVDASLIYDFKADPLHLWDIAVAAKKENPFVNSINKYEQLIKEHGYLGFQSGDAMALFHKVPVGKSIGGAEFQQVAPHYAARSPEAMRVLREYVKAFDQIAPDFFSQSKPTSEQISLQNEIAKAYSEMKMDNLDDPKVRKAYNALIDKILGQYDNVLKGIEVLPWADQQADGSWVTREGQPYKTSADMQKDMRQNKRLYFFTTTPETFGSSGNIVDSHPMLQDSGRKTSNGYDLLNNDILRAVHDAIAHGAFGVQFGPTGEEAAWRAHMATISDPWARWALTTETRGQNSWVNYRDEMLKAPGTPKVKGDEGYVPPADRPFADQKTGLLDPRFMLTGDRTVDSVVTSNPEIRKVVEQGQMMFRPDSSTVDEEVDLGPRSSKAPSQENLDAMKARLPEYTAEIQNRGNSYEILLKNYRGEEVGTASLNVDGDAVVVGDTYIDKQFRSRGYGEALYREIAKLAQKLGRDNLTSWSTSDNAMKVRRKLFGTTYENGEVGPVGPAYDGVRSEVPEDIRYRPDQTASESFKAWFGSSKAVDENGNPVRYYHGTSKDMDFHSFKIGDRGMMFTTDPDVASKYAENNDSQRHELIPGTWKFRDVHTKPRVFPVYLKVENPYKPSPEEMAKVNSATNYASAQRDLARTAKIKGHDSIDWGHGIYSVFRPEQVKSATGNSGEFNPKKKDIRYKPDQSQAVENVVPEGIDSEYWINTRNPSSKKYVDDPNQYLTVGLDAMNLDKVHADKIADLIRKYPQIGQIPKGSTRAQVLEYFIDHVVNNLLWLHDQVPADIRDRSKLWYDGARAITERFSKEFGVETHTVAAVIAAMSPQKDWFQNVNVARRVLEIYTQHGESVVDSKMMSRAKFLDARSAASKKAAVRKRMGSAFDEAAYKAKASRDPKTTALQKTLALMGTTKFKDLSTHQKAVWLRLYDESHNPRSFQIISPEGNFMGNKMKKDGKTDAKVGWGSFAEIAKAISAIEDPSKANISKVLGRQHKVRNFYNNILIPKSNMGDVTIDTHAVAAATLEPMSGKSKEVSHNFGSNGGAKSASTGASGTYPVLAEAYRRAAEARGILPREMQSITWEAVRGLFKDTFKTKENSAAIRKLWVEYKNGKATLDETRSKIVERAGGIENPDWVGAGN